MREIETPSDRLWLVITTVIEDWLEQYEPSLCKTSMAEKLKASLYDQIKLQGFE